jgi:hypothetical protein
MADANMHFGGRDRERTCIIRLWTYVVVIGRYTNGLARSRIRGAPLHDRLDHRVRQWHKWVQVCCDADHRCAHDVAYAGAIS